MINQRPIACALLSSVAFAALLAAAWHASASGRADGSPEEPAATTRDWPMFRGGPGLTGVSPARLPDSLKLAWSFRTGGPVKSSPAIVGGRVYIGSDDGKLYCLNLADGKKIWDFQTGEEVKQPDDATKFYPGAIESSPLVTAGRVFIGSSDGGLYAVEAATGKKVWRLATEDKILGAPNWVRSPDGKALWILVGSYDFKLYAVNADTGAKVWEYESGNYINGSPAVSEGRTVFGGCDALLHVISLADGVQQKEVDAGAYVAGSAALVGSYAIFGNYENEYLSIDIDKGERAWTYKEKQFPYFSSPAVTKDLVVFGGRDKRVHCVNRDTGKSVWNFPTRGKVDSSPVVTADGKVVVGSEDGRLYVLSLKDGNELWNFEIGQPVTSSPAVVENMVVVGGEDGSVYAFGDKSAK